MRLRKYIKPCDPQNHIFGKLRHIPPDHVARKQDKFYRICKMCGIRESIEVEDVGEI